MRNKKGNKMGEIKKFPKKVARLTTMRDRIQYEKELYSSFINEYITLSRDNETSFDDVIELFISNNLKNWTIKTRRN